MASVPQPQSDTSGNVRVCVRFCPSTAELAWSVQDDGQLQQLDVTGRPVTTYGLGK
jgi:hypothetical protein